MTAQVLESVEGTDTVPGGFDKLSHLPEQACAPVEGTDTVPGGFDELSHLQRTGP